MNGEFQNQEPEELRKLWEASPDADDTAEIAEDYLLAEQAARGDTPTAKQLEFVAGVFTKFSDLSDEQTAEVLREARNSPFSNYMKEVLEAALSDSSLSPTPIHRSIHFDPAGFTQEKWGQLPESTQRLLRKDD